VIRAHIGDVVLEELLLGGVALRRSRGQKVALLGGIFGATLAAKLKVRGFGILLHVFADLSCHIFTGEPMISCRVDVLTCLSCQGSAHFGMLNRIK